jgi:Gluconate 2-dehydrogenase subunit 3
MFLLTLYSINMNRRTVIQKLGLGVGSFLTLPSWANAWNSASISHSNSLSVAEDDLLAEIVGSIIPKTDTLGAKEVGVQKFVQRMITDCSEKAEQENFKAGLKKTDELATAKFSKNFVNCSATEKLQLLKELQNSEDKALKNYFGLVKRLTIQGYMNSEYVMTNITKFEFAPGRYNGCVPVKK